MYRKTPYRTGIGMNYVRQQIMSSKLLNGFEIKQTHCLAYILKGGIKFYSNVIKH